MHRMAQLWHYFKIILHSELLFKKILSLKIKQILENEFINFQGNIE